MKNICPECGQLSPYHLLSCGRGIFGGLGPPTITRPLGTTPPTISFTVRLPVKLYAKINKLAKEEGASIHMFIMRSINHYIFHAEHYKDN